MDNLLFDELERKVERLLQVNRSLRQENVLLREENGNLQRARGGVKDRIDAILVKLQEVEDL